MNFFETNGDARNRLIALTNNWSLELYIKKYTHSVKKRSYLEFRTTDWRKVVRMSIYDDEIESILQFLSEKYNKEMKICPPGFSLKNQNKTN